MKTCQDHQIGLSLMLPQEAVEKIDEKGRRFRLKRGPVARLYLAKGIEVFHGDMNMLLKGWNDNDVFEMITMKIPCSINEQLLMLSQKVPLSKKRLSELLVLLAISEDIL